MTELLLRFCSEETGSVFGACAIGIAVYSCAALGAALAIGVTMRGLLGSAAEMVEDLPSAEGLLSGLLSLIGL
jgi:hypothetical protein